jgi:hypothetical protein
MIPIPPAQVQEAPASRDVAFPGFNAFPLAGTVLPATGSAWFAVLVADSGPLDRDWSDPRLPSSHGGRIFSEWLRDQGVGSLRFDKRIAASRDPKLNASLDAQAGDVRAALQAARILPEARGRQVLLVGHGEGALLGLMAAQDADALLLLAMPTQSMAKTIADHIALQLPAAKGAVNLAYLRSVFQAIRDTNPRPTPGPDTYPELVRLGKALMAPETLPFVRDTLDLDPWTMASRVPLPMLIVWGEKDVVAPSPPQLPASYKGTYLEIPGANHLFRKEPRNRTDLDGANALEGYRDDRPLADLAPVADWLKALK